MSADSVSLKVGTIRILSAKCLITKCLLVI
nr:MAG TPA: hypothetical protein [Caudoviricetes sp.]